MKESTGPENEVAYRFDNSREMGKTMANSMSHQLNKEGLTIHMKFSAETGNYIDLWE